MTTIPTGSTYYDSVMWLLFFSFSSRIIDHRSTVRYGGFPKPLLRSAATLHCTFMSAWKVPLGIVESAPPAHPTLERPAIPVSCFWFEKHGGVIDLEAI